MPVRNPYMKKSDDLYVRIKKAANSGRKKVSLRYSLTVSCKSYKIATI